MGGGGNPPEHNLGAPPKRNRLITVTLLAQSHTASACKRSPIQGPLAPGCGAMLPTGVGREKV